MPGATDPAAFHDRFRGDGHLGKLHRRGIKLRCLACGDTLLSISLWIEGKTAALRRVLAETVHAYLGFPSEHWRQI